MLSGTKQGNKQELSLGSSTCNSTCLAEQPPLSQPVLVGEVLQPSGHFRGPPLDPLQQLPVLLVLRAPELDAVLQVPLDDIPSFWRVSCTTQLGVICKLAEGALDLAVNVIDENIEQRWSQYGPLRDTTHH
ncbi:hypothetical protein QYF61_015667 [Mycteria americana]|uniref:Uncharacterized protein n=1 Tax=Mycteria americana TaxID=33587 RepID=A0AAN7NSK3_MYCAM|nr:hypothetical protein QYF61_015667 [Mycteria americana]